MRIVRPGLILGILAWLAACAETYVDPPMRLRAVPAALAGYEVNQPGRVLFDTEARRRYLLTLGPEQRTTLCGEPRSRWPSHPVVKLVRARDDGGPDERSEPFAWTVMNVAAVAYGHDDAAARRSLVRLLDRWARSGGLARLEEDEVNAYYAVDRSLLPTLVAWSLVRKAPDVDEDRAKRIDRWLRRVARLRGDLRPRSSEGDVTRRNNHRYLSASVSMAWGALTGEDSYFREGPDALQEALADMRPDGSLPLETERGARALWYQRHAIASLVTIAEIGAAQGYDLYALEENGRSLHGAVRFLLDAIDDPGLVAPYATADHKAGTAQDPEDQDLSFLAPRGHGRHYMAWAELYMARFPEREESRRLLALLQRGGADFRPMIDDYSGGNTSCFAARPQAPRQGGHGRP